MNADAHPGYGIALEEARRGFDALAGEVTVIRDRAVSTLGMGGLAASFLGGLAIRDGAAVGVWTWIAVAAFVALAVLCTVVLWRRRFHVAQHPVKIVEWIEHNGASSDDVQRDLALWLGRQYDDNRSDVDFLSRVLAVAGVAFLIQIAALVIDLVSR